MCFFSENATILKGAQRRSKRDTPIFGLFKKTTAKDPKIPKTKHPKKLKCRWVYRYSQVFSQVKKYLKITSNHRKIAQKIPGNCLKNPTYAGMHTEDKCAETRAHCKRNVRTGSLRSLRVHGALKLFARPIYNIFGPVANCE